MEIKQECSMDYAAADLTPRERYKVLTSFVLPRPIAWVTSLAPNGTVNAAPFSFFNVFCEDPPLCMFAVNHRPDGRVKDTLTNIERSGEFVVNIADEPLARMMHESSGDFPPDIGEPNYLGLKLASSSKIAVPRLADTPWAMECRTWKMIDVNRDRRLIMGEGIHFYIRDELWNHAEMRVHMERYHPMGRMFADRYCRTDDRVVFPAAQGSQ
jgi:flavin reductase (DIM6/NTAB) family NADH-FMN oxidoreductase RutF